MRQRYGNKFTQPKTPSLDRAGMGQAWWCAVGAGLVFEVPPFVGVDAVEVMAAAVPVQPACALDGSHVQRDAVDVAGFGGWQHPSAGGFGRSGSPDFGAEQSQLGGGVAVSGGDSDELVVAPERLCARGRQRREGAG